MFSAVLNQSDWTVHVNYCDGLLYELMLLLMEPMDHWKLIHVFAICQNPPIFETSFYNLLTHYLLLSSFSCHKVTFC